MNEGFRHLCLDELENKPCVPHRVESFGNIKEDRSGMALVVYDVRDVLSDPQ